MDPSYPTKARQPYAFAYQSMNRIALVTSFGLFKIALKSIRPLMPNFLRRISR
jgi:hypothetical protein